MMALRNYWYIACASSQLRAEPRPVRILDQDLVVYRDGGGRPRVLLDRCCHRGVRLSLGRVSNGHLTCSYHGWRFNGGGECVDIPSLALGRRVSAGCAVPSFPCAEHDSYIWVWLGDAGEPPPPPTIEGFSDHRWTQGSMEMACSFVRGLENNLDWCHPAFAHPWLHGQFYMVLLRGLRERLTAPREFLRAVASLGRGELEATRLRGLRELWISMQLTPDGMVVRGPVSESGEPLADVKSLVTLTFRLPCRADVEVSGTGTSRIVLHLVPTAADRCRLEWLLTSLFPVGRRVRWFKGEPALLRQDRVLLESAERAYAGPSAWSERSVEADAPTLLLRRIIEWAARGEWDQKRTEPSEQRVIRLRS
jgi:phenylpropionate dioxygenase-like ring-hydroxylating dioxygenase large terminal subunit